MAQATRPRPRPQRRRRSVLVPLGIVAAAAAAVASAASLVLMLTSPRSFVPAPHRPHGQATARSATRAAVEARPVEEEVGAGQLNAGLSLLGAFALTEAAYQAAPQLQLPVEQVGADGGSWLGLVFANFASVEEDVCLAALVLVTFYCLFEMAGMQLKCSHMQARLHTACNAGAVLCSLYGIAVERVFRESPGLWWAVLTPLLYGISNLTMSRLMNMYKGPQAYKRFFELGQSFTLSFQGIHLLAWSSVYPMLYWAAMPFWYWSLRKLWEASDSIAGVASGEDARFRADHESRSQTWGSFGLGLDASTLIFLVVNFAAAIIDNVYMGVFTVRGPTDFWEVSRSLAEAADDGGWGSDHLRTALVKPAVGSLAISIGVFVGTLCSRRHVGLALGVPVAAVLSALGPWAVFFWHRLIDPSEPWFPEFLGDGWGPGPLAQLLGQ